MNEYDADRPATDPANPPLLAYEVEWLDPFWNRQWTTTEYAAHFEAASRLVFGEMFGSGGEKFLVSIDGPDGDMHWNGEGSGPNPEPREVSVLVEIDGELAEEFVSAPSLEYAVDLAELLVLGGGVVLGVTDSSTTRLFGIDDDDLLDRDGLPETWQQVLR